MFSIESWLCVMTPAPSDVVTNRTSAIVFRTVDLARDIRLSCRTLARILAERNESVMRRVLAERVKEAATLLNIASVGALERQEHNAMETGRDVLANPIITFAAPQERDVDSFLIHREGRSEIPEDRRIAMTRYWTWAAGVVAALSIVTTNT